MISHIFDPRPSPGQPKRKAVFLDRDGVINVDYGYVYKSSDLTLLPGVVKGLKTLQSNGYELVVVTNQSGIARGYYSLEDYSVFSNFLYDLLSAKGVTLSAIYCCPHHPRGSITRFAIKCDCRKPSSGMLSQAALDLNLNLSLSFMFGDKVTDMLAAKAAGLSYGVFIGNEIPDPIDFPVILSSSLSQYVNLNYPSSRA